MYTSFFNPSFCLCLSVCLRQLTEAVSLPNDDVTRELTPLPPQKDVEERTVGVHRVDCKEHLEFSFLLLFGLNRGVSLVVRGAPRFPLCLCPPPPPPPPQ